MLLHNWVILFILDAFGEPKHYILKKKADLERFLSESRLKNITSNNH